VVRRPGEDLDEENRIEEGVELCVFEARLAAGDDDIG